MRPAAGLTTVKARCGRIVTNESACGPPQGQPHAHATQADELPVRHRKYARSRRCFAPREALDAAIDNLLLAGFDRADIDLVADPDRVYRRLGTLAVRAEDLADVPDTPRRLSSPARRRVGYTTPTAGSYEALDASSLRPSERARFHAGRPSPACPRGGRRKPRDARDRRPSGSNR